MTLNCETKRTNFNLMVCCASLPALKNTKFMFKNVSFQIPSVFFIVKRKDTDVMLALNSDTPGFSFTFCVSVWAAQMSVMVIMVGIMSASWG